MVYIEFYTTNDIIDIVTCFYSKGRMLKMNMNSQGNLGYYAFVTMADGTTWGFNVREEHGNVFTMELANRILDFANVEYKKGCPVGFCAKSYNPNMDFIKVKYDMTNYRTSISHDGDDITVPVDKKRIGIYDKEKNLLMIYEDDMPVYENNNGLICSDRVALADG